MAVLGYISWVKNNQFTDHNHVYWCPGCRTMHMFSTRTHKIEGTMEAPTVDGDLWYEGCRHFILEGVLIFMDCSHELANLDISMVDLNTL